MTQIHRDTFVPLPEGKGMLDQVFLIRQLADAVVDPLFCDASLPDGLRLLLFNEVDAGLGDVAFATKLMGLLGENAPNLSVVLVTSGKEKQAKFGLPAGVSMYGFDRYKKDASGPDRAIDLVLSAPGIFDHCRLKETVFDTLGLPGSIPFLYIAEYGSIRQLRDDAFKGYLDAIEEATDAYLDQIAAREGVSPDHIGYRSSTGDVLAVEGKERRVLGHLTGLLTQPQAPNPLHLWLSQPYLKARSAGFDSSEVGIFIDDALEPPCDRPTLLRELQDDTLRGLLEGRDEAALYSGYAHSAHEYFLDAIAALEEGHERPVDVVMPNAREAQRSLDEFFLPPLLDRLKGAGFGQVEVVGNAHQDGPDHGLAQVSKRFGEGKRLRLITRYPLPHADMRVLLRASEPATMVSGDQSFSEAVSARKECVVIEPVYCQTYHLDAQLALAGAVDPELRKILEFAMKFKRDDAAWEGVRGVLTSGRLSGYFARFNARIHQDHRLNERVVAIVKRALLTSRREEITRAQTTLFENALKTFRPREGLTILGEDLQNLSQAIAQA